MDLKNIENKIVSSETIINKIAADDFYDYEFDSVSDIEKAVKFSFKLPVKLEAKVIWVLDGTGKFPLCGFGIFKNKTGKFSLEGIQYGDSVSLRKRIVEVAKTQIKFPNNSAVI